MVLRPHLFVLSLFFTAVVSDKCTPRTPSQEALLRRDLSCDYDIYTRPRENSQDSINVTVRMVVKNFHFLDTKKSMQTSEATFTVGVWVILTWNDDFLKWNPKDYGNHDETVFPSHMLWTPDLSLYNSISGTNEGSNIGFQIPCLVKNTGKITCIPHMVYETTCKPDYKKWPMDSQNCSMTFGTWMNKGEEVRFKLTKNNPLSVGAAKKNSHWKIAEMGTLSNSGEYECCPNTTYPTISFWVLLKRRSADGILFLTTPALVMILLTLISLLLDINSLERIILMAVNLYFHLFYVNRLSEYAPYSGNSVPDAVLYFRDSTYLACAVLIEGMLLRSILQRSDTVPRWVATITSFTNSGAGKIIMFHEFDPAATAIISGDAEALNKEEMEIISRRDWLKFALLINRVFLICVVTTYIGLFIALMLF